MYKFIFFGAGKRLERLLESKKNILIDNEILFAVDNNAAIWGHSRNGINIYSPDKILAVKYDYVVITVVKPQEIYSQLIRMGVSEDKILTFKQFLVFDYHGQYREYGERYNIERIKKNMVIVAVTLAYNGGAVAIKNAAKAMKEKGYNVLIAAPGADDTFLEELINDGLTVAIIPGLDDPRECECKWICGFDYVMINSFLMLSCVLAFQKYKPVIWWLHESSFFYQTVFDENPQIKNLELNQKTRVFAVSNVAKRCFEQNSSYKVSGILPVAVPDTHLSKLSDQKEKCIFAFVGEILPYKGVHTIVGAFNELCANELYDCELWIVGKSYGDSYEMEIMDKIKSNERIKGLGVLSQKELENVYTKIDAIICASPEETLSIVCIEAMRNEKLCIVSKGAGVADYVLDGENAFVFTPGNQTELLEKMDWVVKHRDEAYIIGRRSREIFLQNFTYNSFGNRFEEIIHEMNEAE